MAARSKVEDLLCTLKDHHAPVYGTQKTIKRRLEAYPFMKLYRQKNFDYGRCYFCHREAGLRWKVVLHGNKYNGPVLWEDRGCSLKTRELERLSHKWMDANDEKHRKVMFMSPHCAWKCWRYHQAM